MPENGKNFNTRKSGGFNINGNSLEEIKEMQKKGIIKANNDYQETKKEA